MEAGKGVTEQRSLAKNKTKVTNKLTKQTKANAGTDHSELT